MHRAARALVTCAIEAWLVEAPPFRAAFVGEGAYDRLLGGVGDLRADGRFAGLFVDVATWRSSDVPPPRDVYFTSATPSRARDKPPRMRRTFVAMVFLAGAAFGATAAGCAAQRAHADAARAEPSKATPAGPDEHARATGIGGIFFKAKDPKKLQAWYVDHLGFPAQPYGVNFTWREKTSDKPGSTTWATFPQTTKYFDPTTATFMINYRVEHLDALMSQLRAAGATVEDKVDTDESGRFAHAVDPEGNRFELWEPTPGH